jgi:hypothetical protein
MTASNEDDDRSFYGGKTERTGQRTTSTPSSSTTPSTTTTSGEASPRDRTESEIEDDIRKSRQDKMRAAEYHDVTKLRQKAAEHRAEAAKFYKKYRLEEADMVKYTQYSSKFRRKAEALIAKGKDALTKAEYKEAELQYLEGGKLERTKIKIAKLKGKAAKLKGKAAKHEAKAAKFTSKAAAKKQKAHTFMEKSKTHEADAQHFKKRADNLERAQGR